jgi:hypothetical protein
MKTTEDFFSEIQRRQQAHETGLGDVIAGATKAVGIKPCGKCQQRQAALNRATPSYVRRLLAWAKKFPVPGRK